jgi:hypothetical protein
MCFYIVTKANAKEILLSRSVTELLVESTKEQVTYVAICETSTIVSYV